MTEVGLVTEMPGTQAFCPCRPTVTDALVHLTPLEGVQVHERGTGPPVPAREGPRRAGKCDVPGIFVNERAEVWKLPDPILT